MSYKITVQQIADNYQGWGWFKHPSSSNFSAGIRDSHGEWLPTAYGATEQEAYERALQTVEEEKKYRAMQANVKVYEVPE